MRGKQAIKFEETFYIYICFMQIHCTYYYCIRNFYNNVGKFKIIKFNNYKIKILLKN